jgi:hypothetical protein
MDITYHNAPAMFSAGKNFDRERFGRERFGRERFGRERFGRERFGRHRERLPTTDRLRAAFADQKQKEATPGDTSFA